MVAVRQVFGRFEIPTSIVVDRGFADLFTVIVNSNRRARFTGAAHFRFWIVGVGVVKNFAGDFTHLIHDVFNRWRIWRNGIDNDGDRVRRWAFVSVRIFNHNGEVMFAVAQRFVWRIAPLAFVIDDDRPDFLIIIDDMDGIARISFPRQRRFGVIGHVT